MYIFCSISNSRYSLQLLNICLRVASDIYDKMFLFSLPADYYSAYYLVLIVSQDKVDRQHFHSLDAVLVILAKGRRALILPVSVEWLYQAI
jgi:hypothetical protein